MTGAVRVMMLVSSFDLPSLHVRIFRMRKSLYATLPNLRFLFFGIGVFQSCQILGELVHHDAHKPRPTFHREYLCIDDVLDLKEFPRTPRRASLL